MTSPGIAELKRHQVRTFGPHSLVPDWKESAAEYGRNFVVTKVFRANRHPSGFPPGIKWFAGEPAASVRGMASTLEPDVIWLSAEMKSWRDIVTVAAHETVHTYGYDAKELYYEHELPTLVGKLAGAHWAGEREVYVKWGSLPDGWLPEGVSNMAELPSNAVVLHFEDGDARTCVNTARSPARTCWTPRYLTL